MAPSREDQHWHLQPGRLAYCPEAPPAAHVSERDVQGDHRWPRPVRNAGDESGAARARRHSVALQPKDVTESVSDARIIIDDQDLGARDYFALHLPLLLQVAFSRFPLADGERCREAGTL